MDANDGLLKLMPESRMPNTIPSPWTPPPFLGPGSSVRRPGGKPLPLFQTAGAPMSAGPASVSWTYSR